MRRAWGARLRCGRPLPRDGCPRRQRLGRRLGRAVNATRVEWRCVCAEAAFIGMWADELARRRAASRIAAPPSGFGAGTPRLFLLWRSLYTSWGTLPAAWQRVRTPVLACTPQRSANGRRLRERASDRRPRAGGARDLASSAHARSTRTGCMHGQHTSGQASTYLQGGRCSARPAAERRRAASARHPCTDRRCRS